LQDWVDESIPATRATPTSSVSGIVQLSAKLMR
jgi:hypothetical protein